MKRVRKRIKTNWAPKAVEAEFYSDSGDFLDTLLLASAGKNAVKVWIHAGGEEWMKNVWLHSYYLKTVHLNKYNRVISF